MYGYIELEKNGKILTGLLKKLAHNYNAYNDKDPFTYCDAHFFYHSRLTFKSDNVNDVFDCLQFLTRKKKFYSGKIFTCNETYEITCNNVNIVPTEQEIKNLLIQDVSTAPTTALQNFYILALCADYIPYMDGFLSDMIDKVGAELKTRGIDKLFRLNMIACGDINKFENIDFASTVLSSRNPFDFNLIRLIPTLELTFDSPEIDLKKSLSAREEINKAFNGRINFEIDYFLLLSYFLKEPLTACYFDINRFLTILKGVID